MKKLSLIAAALLQFSSVNAAFEVFTDRAAWLAAAGGGVGDLFEDFNSFTVATLYGSGAPYNPSVSAGFLTFEVINGVDDSSWRIETNLSRSDIPAVNGTPYAVTIGYDGAGKGDTLMSFSNVGAIGFYYVDGTYGNADGILTTSLGDSVTLVNQTPAGAPDVSFLGLLYTEGEVFNSLSWAPKTPPFSSILGYGIGIDDVEAFTNPTSVLPASPLCGTTLTKNTTLDSDMNCPSRALRFSGTGSKKITLDCAGYSISTASDRVISADFVSRITIENCTLVTTHEDGRGIVFTGVKNSKISGNTISTSGDLSRAIGLRGNSSSNSITDNIVHTGGSNSEGILIRTGSDKNTVKNNIFEADASYAVSIQSASNNMLSGNTLISPDGYLFQGKFSLQNGGMTVDAAGNIYAVENNWGSSAGGGAGIGKATAFFQVDPATGAAFSVMPLKAGKKDVGFGFDALEILPNGRVLALAGVGAPSLLYEIDPNTGKVAEIALNMPTLNGKPNGLEATSETTLLATTNRGELLEIDLTTGNVSEIGQQDTGLTGLALHPTNGKAYAVSRRRDESSNTAHLYEINVNTGEITQIGDTGIFLISDIDFAPDGTLYGNYNLEVIDIITGLSTTVGDFGPDPLEPLSNKNRLKGNLFQNADGSVQFTGNITLPSVAETDISSERVEIMANQVMVDSVVLPFLDEKARIRLNNITGTYHNLLVDPEDDGSFLLCQSPRCKFVSFQNGTLVFDVKGFTTYASAENSDPTIAFVAEVVLAEIKLLQSSPGVSKAARKKLKSAISKMTKALKFLRKNNAIKGLTEISKAVADLLKAGQKGVAVTDLIDKLVGASQAEAQAKLDEAIAAGGNQALIDEAQAKMTEAQDLLNQGKPDKAINSFRLAWAKADKSFNSGGGGSGGKFGKLNVTGNDTGKIGGGFSPKFATPFGNPTAGATWTANKGVQSATTVSLTFGQLGSLSYIFATSKGKAHAYSLACFVTPNPCNGISVDLVKKEVTFDNVVIEVAQIPNNKATAPIVVDGTLRW